ncbi:twin arginine-targeting protein translocase TatB [Gordonia westfalica]|uniref:Twin arginine-targeting protein translocase TatB n=1 Tax=Gordonia westfalica TaxID=158898 RepID=A0A1H2J6Q6_9ACTN|nr:twin arginine-targeting protein translocase TatB [Gordonia westfalica]
MFSSIGWGEIAILIVAALVILGPERLPGAVSWSMQSLRKVRDYATGATNQLKDELGPNSRTCANLSPTSTSCAA